jgi:hypothetical protein
MTVTRSPMPDLLWPGIQATFGITYDKLPKEYTRIFDIRKSTKAYEKVLEITGMGLGAVKGEGASILYDTPGQGPSTVFTHVTYGLGYIVTREAIEDNQYEDVTLAGAAALPWSMWTTKEIVHANVLNRATTSGYTGGDGVVLGSASHPTANGTQSNLLTAADLSESALEDALTTIAFKTLGLVPEIVVNHYLDDADAWYLQTNVPNGLISYQRRALDMEDDSDFDTENKKYKATERYSAGWADWRSVFVNVGA